MVFLQVAIIMRFGGCGFWTLAAFCGTLFQLDISPFKWIESVMEDMSNNVRR
jgi:hypothetical protein